MKIAFILYEGLTALDFVAVYDPLTRLKTMGFRPDLAWETCGLAPEIRDGSGLLLHPTRVGDSLAGYDLLVIPGGESTRDLLEDPAFIDWLKSGSDVPLKASVSTGALLMGAAGWLESRRATTHPAALPELERWCGAVVSERIVDEGDLLTAGGVTAGIDLGLHLVEKIAGTEARRQIQAQVDYPCPALLPDPALRQAEIARHTGETDIRIRLLLDGSGEHTIATGIGFFDHMLTHLAVHGLFDLEVQASGDLHVDVHHTIEDVALALGQAFDQALGSRAGLVRMASAYAPMDETLAFVAVDLSGRPHAAIEAGWHTGQVGGIPCTLFAHFFESFSVTARCNLHARVLSGRDDHHQAEALFKAWARAMDAATRMDPRRAGKIPSTKGSL